MIRDTLKKTGQYIGHYGLPGLTRKVMERQMTKTDYDSERLEKLAGDAELAAQRQDRGREDPLISILVPVYNPDELPFLQMLESVKAQSYENWQLCLADASAQDYSEAVERVFEGDERISYSRLEKNEGIVGNTNAALGLAGGAYVAFLDQDDVLEPDALYEIIRKIRAGADFIYTDEDKVSYTLDHYERPFRKPDYNRTLLWTTNYICHFMVIATDLVKKLGGLRQQYEGAQDYDLALRATSRATKVEHVAKVLYHWRSGADSTSANPFNKEYAFEAGRRALEAALLAENVDSVRVTGRENPGYYEISLTRPSIYLATIRKEPMDSLADILDDYVLLLPEGWKITNGSLERLVERAEITGADLVVPRQVKRGRYVYNGMAKAGEGHTASLVGKPSWYHGPYQLGVVNLDVDAAPVRGILIRTRLLPLLVGYEEKHISRKTDWAKELRMVYAPEVTITRN